MGLMLIDSEIEGDRRVLRALSALGEGASVKDIRASVVEWRVWKLKIVFITCFFIVKSLCVSIPSYGKLTRLLTGRVNGSIFKGVPACVRWLYCSIRSGLEISGKYDQQNYCIYANDLYCAVAALLIVRPDKSYIIYDSHELQIHRNRNAGWLRVLIEYGLEQCVLRHVAEVKVVNKAIMDVMKEWYEIKSPLSVDYNDHYIDYPLVVPLSSMGVVMVYVGKGIRGRKLELLDRPASELGFRVVTYFLGTDLPDGFSKNFWESGPVDYEHHLSGLVQNYRCLMWCCLDSISLSYQLATPNKFFQALALGVPVVASDGTYLAEIVEKYKIGMIFDGVNMGDISLKSTSPLYNEWSMNIGSLRSRLRSGEVVI